MKTPKQIKSIQIVVNPAGQPYPMYIRLQVKVDGMLSCGYSEGIRRDDFKSTFDIALLKIRKAIYKQIKTMWEEEQK